MPLRGKIVVIKRSGGDGTEFPLTASCLFGRKPDCDIRIQLPQVSKEHCRIDLNENKEVILTNLSSVNPTRVNGEVLNQAERLKHGDVITVIDRSFRFEYPPASTPKKRSSRGGKLDTLKVLQDQQVGDKAEKRVSEVSTDPLKDGTNNNNIQHSLEKTVLESQEGDSSRQSKSSPFNDLYQMIKKSLDVKTPRKSSISLLQTPCSKFCTPKPASVRKSEVKPATVGSGAHKKDDAKVEGGGTPQSTKKRRTSSLVLPTEPAGAREQAASPQRRSGGTPEKFTVSEVIEQITQTPKSPVRRRSKETTPTKPSGTKEQAKQLQTASPRNSAKGREASKKRKSGELGPDLAAQELKRKRVSFGGQLSPELFDKRLPPDSPLRKGANPRRSLSLLRPKQSLLRRASVIGTVKESPGKTKKSSAAKTASPKTPTPEKKGRKSKSSPAMKSPKSASPSPKAATPATKSPKSASASPRGATPAKRSPKAATPAKTSPKAATPAKRSPKAATPAKTSPKAATPAKTSPKAATPATKSPKSASSSPKAATPRSLSPAGRTPARDQRVPTPAVQGRFSVSRIATPSPVAEANTFTEQLSSVAVTPVLRLKRKSMKSTSKKTPSISKSAIKVIQRRSGISRASLKVSNCWADIVKFGKPKAQLVAQSHVKIAQKTVKKTAPKPLQKTPARKLKGHVSTGHADSPATIVVGRAHKRTVNHLTGAAPRVITNIALFRKNLRMDEDLSGISEMFKTPVSKKKSVSSANSDVATPAGPAASVIEPSLLNTPEEPGEMVVSPLSVASIIKGRRYNSEAVQRLLNGDEESSLASDASALQIESEAAAVKTPRQKSEVPDCLTGVKRILKTPRQKAEPVDDIRGRLLRTPRQKPEQEECLSAVKRVFKTPQHEDKLQSLKVPEAPQVADILETPSTKRVSQDLSEATETPVTESRRMVKTPREKGAPVEDMVGVKRIMRTPKVKGQPVEDNFGIKRLMRSPRLRGNSPVEDFQGLMELMEEPVPEPEEQRETNQDDPEPVQCGADVVQELEFKPQNDESSDAVNVSKLDVTKAIEAVYERVDIQSVPDVPGPTDVEEIVPEAAAEENLLQQPNVDKVDEDLQAQEETTAGKSAEVEATVPGPGQDKTIQGTSPAAPVRGRRGRKVEAAAPPAAPQMKRGRTAKVADVEVVVEETPEAEVAVKPKRGRRARKVADEEEVVPAAESEQSRPAGAQLPADDDDAAAPEKLAAKPKRGRKAKQPEGAEPEQQDDSPAELTEESNPDFGGKSQSEPELNKPADADEAQSSAAGQRKAVRGRRGKQMEAEEKQEVAEEPVRGRRGRKVEAAAPPAAPQMKRGRSAKVADVEVVVEETPEAEVAVKPKRGRRARKVPDEEEVVPAAESEQSRPAGAQLPADDAAAPEKLAAKPKRGRKAKQPEGAEPEQQDDSRAELTEEATDVSEKLDESRADEAQSSAAGQRKAVRGRRGKQMEAEEKQEVAEEPVRGRRGRKVEAAAPPAAPQLKRGRSAKTQEKSSRQAADETPESEKSEPPEPQTEDQPVQMVVCEEAVVKPAAAKPRRGARAKPEAPSVSIQAQEEKPKRGRRGRRAAEEQEVASQNQTTAEESGNGEPDAAVLKPSKTRGAKPAQGEPLPVVPAKRARRGGAAVPPLEETGSATVNSSEDWIAGEEAKTSKTVKWNAELEVIKIPKTAVRAGRGRKSKVADKSDSGSQDVPEAEQAEEDLSGKTVDAPPGKRTRRGTKTADVSADKEEPPETLPKVRRGRPARK